MVGKKSKAGTNSKAVSPNPSKTIENNGVAESPVPETSPATVEPIEAKELTTELTTEKKSTEAKKATKPNSDRAAKSTNNGQTVETVEPQTDKKSAKKQEQAAKKAEKEDSSEKSVKMKRLTLDISKPLHKAIKAKAVEEGVPMADMLRSLLKTHYGQ
ncbi:MAG: hypothetical protein KME13_14480 [Myxacorys californica WJT36-NPBG1]|jgi:predicted DNA binding CopG/RHH family protein|nr:hypothetical protein [Myxacorys californica WJT36-NPBG1]